MIKFYRILWLIVFVLIIGCGNNQNLTSGIMKLTSSAFENGGMVPSKYTCDGGDINPPLMISGVPENTKSLALIVDDPDAPIGLWVHFVLWNIDPATSDIAEGSMPTGSTSGTNSWGKTGYGGPCPPSGTHRYFFKLYALDTTLDILSTVDKAGLEKAMRNHILDQAELLGNYSRQ